MGFDSLKEAAPDVPDPDSVAVAGPEFEGAEDEGRSEPDDPSSGVSGGFASLRAAQTDGEERGGPSGKRRRKDDGLDEIVCFLVSNKARSAESRFRRFRARSGRKSFDFLTSWVLDLRSGDTVKAHGRWKDDGTFWAEHYEIQKPSSTLGIRKWFEYGAVPGVGVAIGDRLAEFYGEDLIRHLHDVEALARVPGVPRAKAELIVEKFQGQPEYHSLVVPLMDMGLHPSNIAEIVDVYGQTAIDQIHADPWSLARIDGISFERADEIAVARNAMSHTAPSRIMAGLEFALKSATDGDGHSGVSMEDFEKRCIRTLATTLEPIRRHMPEFLARPDVVYDSGIVSRAVDRQVERTVAYDIARIMKSADIVDIGAARKAVAQAEKDRGVNLDDSQREAAIRTLASPLSVITGGPGVGKSTTLAVIVGALAIMGSKPVLAAPTGRASKRMSEVTDLPSSTIHRLLRFDAKQKGGFHHGRAKPLPKACYIFDETSMMDIRLCRSVLEAMPDGARVITVGDVDQLPSVGPGQVLRDIISSGCVPVSRLTKIHRQGENSGIVKAAYSINRGFAPKPVKNDRGFTFHPTDDDDDLLPRVVELFSSTLKSRGFDPRTEVQVLATLREKGIGVDRLNAAIKRSINPGNAHDGRTIEHRGRLFSVGDRVIHNRNRHAIGVYNGDVGYVISADYEDKVPRLAVDYGESEVVYDGGQILDLDLCYATTIHKSQGSEYRAVIVLVPRSHAFHLNRNLLYTAVTRAKDLCFLVGDEQTLREGVANVKGGRRVTSLAMDVLKEFATPSRLADIERLVQKPDRDGSDTPGPAIRKGAPRTAPTDDEEEMTLLPEHRHEQSPSLFAGP